jgi:nicotinamide-nucleotide amidase
VVTDRQINSLAEYLVEAMIERDLTVSTAESCTGGLIGGALTSIAGSSSAYLGGCVTYSNQAKVELLGVRHKTILEHGAVSEACACEMAVGVRQRLHSDYAVSVTGIAGPDGGSPEKPVGSVWIGLAGPDGVRAQLHHFAGDRHEVRRASVAAALQAVGEVVTSG